MIKLKNKTLKIKNKIMREIINNRKKGIGGREKIKDDIGNTRRKKRRKRKMTKSKRESLKGKKYCWKI